MTTEEATALIIKAIKAAIERDIGSGGKKIQVAVINRDGFKELTPQEIKKHS